MFLKKVSLAQIVSILLVTKPPIVGEEPGNTNASMENFPWIDLVLSTHITKLPRIQRGYPDGR